MSEPQPDSGGGRDGGGDLDLSAEVLNNLTTCGICLELFKEPKSLPCLHSFCRVCLINLTHLTRQPPAGSHNGGSFPCPTCRRLCYEINIAALPDDFKSKLLVDTIRNKNRSSRRNTTQVTSSSLPSGSGCNPLADEELGRAVLCELHGNRRCEFFCNEPTCMKAVCVKCVSLDHRKHCYIDVFDDSQLLVAEMQGAVAAAERDIKALEEMDAEVGILFSEFNFKLEERCRRLKRLVDQTKNHMLAEYSHLIGQKQSAIKHAVSQQRNFLNTTNSYLSKLSASVQHGGSGVFQVYGQAKMHLEGSTPPSVTAGNRNLLLERPPKFEFAPYIEFSLSAKISEFFGHTVIEPQAADQPSSSLPQPGSSASSSSGSGGARRRRQYHVATNLSKRQPSSSSSQPNTVEELFSLASLTQASNSAPVRPGTESVAEGGMDAAIDNDDRCMGNIGPILLSTLRQQANFIPPPSVPPMFISRDDSSVVAPRPPPPTENALVNLLSMTERSSDHASSGQALTSEEQDDAQHQLQPPPLTARPPSAPPLGSSHLPPPVVFSTNSEEDGGRLRQQQQQQCNEVEAFFQSFLRNYSAAAAAAANAPVAPSAPSEPAVPAPEPSSAQPTPDETSVQPERPFSPVASSSSDNAPTHFETL